ncbi:TPA: beta-2-microglobulin precursor, partial [Bos taurus]
RDL